MTEQIKLAIIGLLTIAIFAMGWHFGDKHSTEKYLPQIIQLQDAINTADEKAKQDQKTYKENADAIQKTNDARISAIRDYYRGLLQPVPTQDSQGTPSSGSQATNGTSGKQTTSRRDFEQACILDALQVTSWQEWAI